jgi:hypothetical protein
MSDISIKCNDDKIVKAHSLILCSTCEYFNKILLTEIKTIENETKVIEFEIVNSNQMEIIIKYLYTKEFEISTNDVF